MSARLSLNHSYFYDALSGEFLPPSDSKGRKHTLSRLLNATIERGVVSNPNSHQEKRVLVPTWAPIESVVHISHWDIHSLTLTADDRKVRFVHTLQDALPRSISVFDTDYSDGLVFDAPLGHPPDYDRIQNRIRNIAQNFFEAFPAPKVLPINE